MYKMLDVIMNSYDSEGINNQTKASFQVLCFIITAAQVVILTDNYLNNVLISCAGHCCCYTYVCLFARG